MSRFNEIINAIENIDKEAKNNLWELLFKAVTSSLPLSKQDKELVLNFCLKEMESLITEIPKAENYRAKDMLFHREDVILGIFFQFYKNPDNVPEPYFSKIDTLVKLIDSEMVMENAVNKIFTQEKIEEAYIDRLISLLTNLTDEYQKSKFYSGLINYQEQSDNLTAEAKKKLSAYIAAEQKRYLSMKYLSDDCLEGFELSVDACKCYITKEITDNLYAALKLGKNNVSYYTVETLLCTNNEVPQEIITSLANDLVYADITYSLLERFRKTDLFPNELTDPVYLAKSDLVHWLTYPTELGKAPDSIEYIGRIKKLFRSEVFHVFKYISSSDNLDEESKNKWLIGWSSNEGGTFSNFDKYDDYDLGSVEKTLKNIKKKLIG